MGRGTKATDWEVAGVAQVGGAATVGGGLWMFEFKSSLAGMKVPFLFIGAGLGLGGSIGGASAPDMSSGQPSYTALRCDRAFGVDDLSGSAGRLTTAGAGMAVGYGVVIITAFNFRGPMFASQECYGFTIGVGASAMTTVGMWQEM